MELLLVEDDLGLSELILERMELLNLHCIQVYTAAEALSWLDKEKADLMLLDYSLPDMLASQFILEINNRNIPKVPFIVTTGRGDESIAVSMMKLGARDYIIKDSFFLDRLPALVKRTLDDLENVRQREIAEEELRKNEEDLSITLESIGDGIIVVDEYQQIIRMNPMSETFINLTKKEAFLKDINQVLDLFYEESQKSFPCPVKQVLATGKSIVIDQPLLLKNQMNRILISLSISPLRDRNEKVRGAVLVLHDMTEQIQLQEKLNQSQKLDAIGRLAAGVAHDFNNRLAGILNAADLMTEYLPDNKEYHSILEMLINSAENAAELTKQLLSFGRRQSTTMVIVDIHSLINETLEILHRTLNRSIILKTNFLAKQYKIKGDASLIENVLINLAINGSHAMPQGGDLSISTMNQIISANQIYSMEFDLKPGTYISISIHDTGIGINPKDLDRIFEPFFTTKRDKKGSGLGLATSYGTILQHNGAIWVESELGKGSTFTILLPTIDQN